METKNSVFGKSRNKILTSKKKYNHSKKGKLAQLRYKQKHREEIALRSLAFSRTEKGKYGSHKWQKENPKKANKSKLKYSQSKHGKLKRHIYQQQHKEIMHARRIAKKYIPIKGLCQKCHIAKATERHHSDYSKPLKIILVCRRCHRRIHAKPRK